MDSNLVALLLLVGLPLTFGLLLVVIYLLARRWKGDAARVGDAAARLVSDARRREPGLRRIQADYTGLHRQPYSSLAANLGAEIDALVRAAGELEQAWQALDARREARMGNRLMAYLGAGQEALNQRRMADDLLRLRAAVEERLRACFELVHRLESVPQDVSQRMGGVTEGIEVFGDVLAELEDAGLHGRLLDEAGDALLQLQQAQAHLPLHFGGTGREEPAISEPGPQGQVETVELAGEPARELQEAADAALPENFSPVGEEVEILRAGEAPAAPAVDLRQKRAALLQEAGDAHDLLVTVEPVLGEWLPRVKGWQQQLRRLEDAAARLRRTIANFRGALSTPPAQLVVTHFQAELLKVSTTARELETRAAGAEVQELRALERETSLLERTLEQTALNYDRSVRETEELDRLLLQLEADYKTLAGRMAQAETHEAYPLLWEASRASVNELQERIAALGRRELRRTPDQVSQALSGGKEIQERLAALLTRTAEQNERYAELVKLLETPELAGGLAWAAKAIQLSRETALYDPTNWNRQDDVANLGRDMAALDELQRRLVPPNQPAPVKESGLARRLEETRGLVALHQKQRPRVERLRQRLAELREQERDARDECQRCNTTLDQLAQLLNSSSYLQQTAASELSRLRDEGERLADEFENRQSGSLEKKLQRLKTLQDGLLKSVTTWLDRLSANLQVHTRSIADGLAALDKSAPLEDREVNDAREILRRLGPAPAYGRPATYMEAAAALKRCAADWQAAAGSASALDTLAQPVLGALAEAEGARSSARAIFQSSARLAAGRREWPPARRGLESDLEEFRKLEARLDGLRGQRWTAARLVRELGQLFHELDRVDDRAAQAVRQAESDRAAALEAEQDVVELQRQWQAVARRHADQPGVGDSARDLVSQAEQRLNTLKTQYRRGALDYEQVMAELQELSAALRGARVMHEDGRSVGIDQ